MDVDTGTFIIQYFIFNVLIFVLEARASSLPVRLLPYSLVPGISFHSPLYLKAVSVISKQKTVSPSTTATSTSENSMNSICTSLI
jgi:hypothetical protein